MARPGAMVGTYDYVADTRYNWGGLVFLFSGGSRAVLGIQVEAFGFKDQPVYTAEQPEGTGSVYSVNETFAGLTPAQNFSDRFSAGITAKGVFDQLGGTSGRAFALDFGTNFHSLLSGHPIQFSFVLSNLGTNLSYSGNALHTETPRQDPIPGEPEVPQNPQPTEFRTSGFNLPTIFRVGLAYDLMMSDSRPPTVLSATSTSPTTTGPAFRAARSGSLTSGVAPTSASRSVAATAISARTTSARPISTAGLC